MNTQSFRFKPSLVMACGALLAFGLVNGNAFAGSKSSSSSSSRPAPATHSAPAPARSSGGGGSASRPSGASGSRSGPTIGGGSFHSGPAANGAGVHAGPTANGAGVHAGPTANGTAVHAGPTANGSSFHDGPAANGAANANHAGFTTSNAGAHTTTATTMGAHSIPTNGAGGMHSPTPMNRTATGGRAPAGSRTMATNNGAVTRRPNGKISDVHDAKRGMDVHHGLNGSRRVSAERPDHSRVVAERGRRGYVERRYSFHGHDYGRRSYYWHGHEYNRFYRGYYYHGAFLNVYAPGFYYAPAFYGWAYNPWYAPVRYGWGWGGSPWYGYYGYYFAPAPVYASPADWLTDYVISSDLTSAYAAQQEAQTDPMAGASPTGQPLLTPEIKAQISEEVRAQIALENAEAQQNVQGQEPDPASSSVNRIFGDGKPHVFVTNSALDVVDASGKECALSDGDVLRLNAAPASDATDATLNVVVSKGGKECPASSAVTVAVADLQEMQNGMRETVDQGLQELQSNQGKNGIPAAPRSAMAPTVQTAFAQAAPPAEVNGAAAVNMELTAAEQVDTEAAQGSAIGALNSPLAAPSAATVNIEVGQTIAEVTSSLGQPVSIIDLGVKKVYKYKDLKVTFKSGKVADVE